MRHIDVLYAQAVILHFYAPKHRSMVEMQGPIGTRSSTSVQSRNAGNLTIDGEQIKSLEPMSILPLKVLNVQQKIHSHNVQQQAMMHGVSRPAASSMQGGCPTIAEHQAYVPPMQQQQQHVILPNPGYKIEANLWHLDVQVQARYPGPLASFLRHCNTMDSPYVPTYGKGGPQPADDISHLDRSASMDNLRDLQKYSEKLQFEATCCRLWANGIQDQIMDEQERVQTWISGMTDELIRLKRIQPAWIHQLQTSKWSSSTSTFHGSIFHSAAPARVIQCSFNHRSQTSPDVEESLYGICTEECSISINNECGSMG